jgi:UPF0755 protein
VTFLDERGQPPANSASGGGPSTPDGNDLYWDDESQFVKTRSPLFRVVRSVVAVVILGFIGLTTYRLATNWFAAQLDPEGEPGAATTVFVEAGSTTGDIAGQLEDAGVVPNSTFFRYYAEWNDVEAFQAGEYTLQQNMSAEEAIAVLSGGPKQIEYGEFVVPEGLWLNETLERIAEQVPQLTVTDLEQALDSGFVEPRYRPDGVTSWEGLLFPAKYFIEEDISAEELLAKMSNEFAAVTADAGYGAAERTHGMSAYDIVIIASLIEAEAKTDGDRPKISRVIHNRLAEGIPIGIDATTVFDKGVRGEPIFQSDLESDSPYNTRINPGLPPTPIAMPGRASLEAAMEPIQGPWLYYVLIDEQGNHRFAETLAEHNQNVAEARSLGLLD